jgi:hypothetical protein
VWDYPIKEQYGHILQAITQTGPVENATVGFQKVLLFLHPIIDDNLRDYVITGAFKEHQA